MIKVVLGLILIAGTFLSSAAIGQTVDEMKADLNAKVAEIKAFDDKMKAASDDGDHDLYEELLAKRIELKRVVEDLNIAIQGDDQRGIFAQKEYNDGNLKLRTGDYAGSIANYKKSLELEPQNASAYYNMGVSYSKLKKLTEAQSAFEMAIQQNAEYAKAHVSLGNIYNRKKDNASAMTHFQAAIAIDPNSAKAHYGVGSIQFKKKKYSDAIVSMKAATEAKGNFTQAWIILGRSLSEINKNSEAVSALRKAVKIKSKSWKAHHHLAVTLNKMEKFTEAIKSADNCLKYKKNYAAAYYEKGFAAMSLGQKKVAKAAFEKAKSDRAWREISDHYIKKIDGKIQ